MLAAEINISGCSLTDYIMGTNMGGPRGPAFQGTAEEISKLRMLRHGRSNRTWAVLMLALSGNPILVQGLQHDLPDHDVLQVGEALNIRFDAPIDQIEISNLQREWLYLNLPQHIGCDEHTVQRLAQRMSVLNAQLPEGDRYGEDMSAEKLLLSVEKASQ